MLQSIVQKIGVGERREVCRRAYLAKEMTINLVAEIENKMAFVKKIRKTGAKEGILVFEMITKMRFVEGRLQLLSMMMDRAEKKISLSLEKFS